MDLDRKTGGVTILPPYIKEGMGAWYSGTANAIYQNIKFIDAYNQNMFLYFQATIYIRWIIVRCWNIISKSLLMQPLLY